MLLIWEGLRCAPVYHRIVGILYFKVQINWCLSTERYFEYLARAIFCISEIKARRFFFEVEMALWFSVSVISEMFC